MVQRTERERHYERLAGEAAQRGALLATRSRRYSWFRLVIFLAALGLLLAGTLGRPAISAPLVLAALAGFAAFTIAVFAHDRVELDRARAAAGRECAEISRARMAREWDKLPPVGSGPDVSSVPASPLAAAIAADLDVDGEASVMSFAGALTSLAGQRILRRWFIDPPAPIERIRARQEAAQALASCPDFREAFTAEVRMSVAGRQHDEMRARDTFLTWTGAKPVALSAPAVRWAARLWTAATLICLAGALVAGAPWTRLWAPLVLASFAVSLAAMRHIHRELDAASLGPSALSNLASVVSLAEALPARAEDLEGIRARLSQPASASAGLGSLARRVGWSELRRTAPVLHLPLQALLLWDFHVLFALDDWRAKHGAQTAAWLDAVAELEALVALGTLSHDEPAWTFPLIEDGGPVSLMAVELGHPLIPADRRIPNDVEIGPPGTVLLVTGSNMAGKSTLLRAIGTNVMLTNAGAPVCATRMTLSRLALATSLRTSDSLAQGVSGYMAGLISLKQVIDAADAAAELGGGPSAAPVRPAVLYLLDEILAGTNSEDRRAAIREILRHLLESRAIGAITTHDLGLADEPALQRAAVQVHFRETVEPSDSADGRTRMTFDYLLRPGLATSTNAMGLLRALGLGLRPSEDSRLKTKD